MDTNGSKDAAAGQGKADEVQGSSEAQQQTQGNTSTVSFMTPAAGVSVAGNDGVPQLMPQINLEGTFANIDPSTMPGALPNSFFADPSVAPIGVADPSVMVPLMMPNGELAGSIPPSVTADDIALYDRQIRLWGVDAQARIQRANILLVNLRGLSNEIAKNLVLAGVGSLTILDNGIVTEADLGAQFFLTEEDEPLGKNRAEAACPNIQKLNPRVRVHVDTEGVTTKVPTYFAAFDVVIATDLDPTAFNLINIATRINYKPFYAAGTYGMYGFIFSDLIQHNYVIERDVGNVPTVPKQETSTRSIIDVKTRQEGPKTIESVTKSESYSTWFLASDLGTLPEEFSKSKRRLRSVSPALSCLRALWEFMQVKDRRLPSNRDDLKVFTQMATQKHKAMNLPPETLSSEFLRSFLQNLGCEIAPVTAILGGQLAQDVINVLGGKQQPIQNFVIFDGNTMEASMYPLHPEGDLGTTQLQMPDAAPLPNNGTNLMMQPGMNNVMDMSGMQGIDTIGGMGSVLNDPLAGGLANPYASTTNMLGGDLSMGMQMPIAPNGPQTMGLGTDPVAAADLASGASGQQQQPPRVEESATDSAPLASTQDKPAAAAPSAEGS